MEGILERHDLHSKNLDKLEQPSTELQVSLFFPSSFKVIVCSLPNPKLLRSVWFAGKI